MLKGKTPLIIAAILGLVAFLVSWSAIKKREAEVRKGWDLVPVVVAGVDIPEGTVVTLEMIKSRSVPEGFVTASVVKPDSANYIVNQKVLVPLQAGDPLLWSQFETTKGSERLSNKVQRRTRAITLSTQNESSVGGWVRPNDHVDIIGTFKDTSTNEQVAVTLMQDIIVLATGRITGTTNVNLLSENQREYSNVSVMVLPEEAEMLVLAQELGTLTLSLRNDEDVEVMNERARTTIGGLIAGERLKVLQKIRQSVIVYKGAGQTVEQHEHSNSTDLPR